MLGDHLRGYVHFTFIHTLLSLFSRARCRKLVNSTTIYIYLCKVRGQNVWLFWLVFCWLFYCCVTWYLYWRSTVTATFVWFLFIDDLNLNSEKKLFALSLAVWSVFCSRRSIIWMQRINNSHCMFLLKLFFLLGCGFALLEWQCWPCLTLLFCKTTWMLLFFFFNFGFSIYNTGEFCSRRIHVNRA